MSIDQNDKKSDLANHSNETTSNQNPSQIDGKNSVITSNINPMQSDTNSSNNSPVMQLAKKSRVNT